MEIISPKANVCRARTVSRFLPPERGMTGVFMASSTKGWSQRPARMESMKSPPIMPAARPAATYTTVNFQPSSPQSSTTAISLMMGEVMRNDMVMPMGMPAVVKPRKSGTLEQEQNGVMAPNMAPSA